MSSVQENKRELDMIDNVFSSFQVMAFGLFMMDLEKGSNIYRMNEKKRINLGKIDKILKVSSSLVNIHFSQHANLSKLKFSVLLVTVYIFHPCVVTILFGF